MSSRGNQSQRDISQNSWIYQQAVRSNQSICNVPDDDYLIDCDFEDISLSDTIVEDNDDGPKDIAPDNYYNAIAFDDNSDYEQNNEEIEMDQATVNSNTKTNNTVVKTDPDANTEGSIPETEISTDKPHSTNNGTTDMNNAGQKIQSQI